MIGVIANPSDHPWLAELFQLFKTPWELHRGGGHYSVLVCVGDVEVPDDTAQLVVVYAASQTRWDGRHGLTVSGPRCGATISTPPGKTIPLYGNCVHFSGQCEAFIADEQGNAAGVAFRVGDVTNVRIGYDLCDELQRLLGDGQPAANANVPTLELHIDLLRRLIVASGIPVMEIPPAPQGYTFTCCLTHDIDHPGIRFHGIDHAVLGFLYRAVVGSVREVLRGRKQWRQLSENWRAAMKFPLVKLGLAKDYWDQFDAYRKLENGAPSTFFVVPYKAYAGRTSSGQAPALRATAYGARDIASELQRMIDSGCEIALHGLDAWLDPDCARKELSEISAIAQTKNVGVRMHWLYFDRNAPSVLESAGAAYDATVGYNDAVGYRSGSTQIYMMPGTGSFLEVPLHLMDTALFREWKLDMTFEQAKEVVAGMIRDFVEFGGALTLNWHDRSLGPERLWGDFYVKVLQMLRAANVWFATARQATTWFRARRAAEFRGIQQEDGQIQVRIFIPRSDELPGFKLRVLTPKSDIASLPPDIAKVPEYSEFPLTGGVENSIRLPRAFSEAFLPSCT